MASFGYGGIGSGLNISDIVNQLVAADRKPADNALTLLPGERVALRVSSDAEPDALRRALRITTLADALSEPSSSRSTATP